jgi:murein DD-endopeptidase MepM/ murein hydrolase activator NlpD
VILAPPSPGHLRSARRALFATTIACVTFSACNPREALHSLAPPPTAHGRYAKSLTDAGLGETALGREWLAASDSALRAPLDVTLPFEESGFYSRAEARAVAYRVRLRGGERLALSVSSEGLPAELFVDLFEQRAESGDSVATFDHRASAERLPIDPDSGLARDATMPIADSVPASSPWALHFEAEHDGTFVVRFQPELLRDGRFVLAMRTEPILAFPVEGRDGRAVQSFFGANREAGRRLHQGIDIFAPRGTPALAAVDGVVRSISPNQLGGNVVWLSDARHRQTLYYAHLDRHAVVAGQSVRVGDTLGFVGNTGNARTTSPHLHFGVYRRGQGPVDPLPWVRRTTAAAPRLTADTTRLGARGEVVARSASLRVAPATRADTVRRVARGTPLRLMGAAGGWYRVQFDDGVAGYLPAREVGTP